MQAWLNRAFRRWRVSTDCCAAEVLMMACVELMPALLLLPLPPLLLPLPAAEDCEAVLELPLHSL